MMKLLTVDEMSLIHLDDMSFSIAYEADEYNCDFRVYEIIGWQDSVQLFNRKGYTSSPDPVEDIEDAQIFLHGHIKWDGCSNWHFDEQDSVMLHFCSKKQGEDIGKLFSQLYKIAEENISNWDGE